MKSIREADLMQIPKNASIANALESMNRFLKRIGLNYRVSWRADDLELSQADDSWVLTETKKQELILQFQTELEKLKAEMIQRKEKLVLEIEREKGAFQDNGYPTKTDMIRADANLRLAKAEKGKIGKTTSQEKRKQIEESYDDVLRKRNTVFNLLQESETRQRLIERLIQELKILSDKISKNWYLEVDFKDIIGALRVDSQEIESEEEEVVSPSHKRKWNYPIGAVAGIVAGIVALTLFAKMKSDSASNHTMSQFSLHDLAKMTPEQRLKSMADQSNIIIQKMLNRIAEDGSVVGCNEEILKSFKDVSMQHGFSENVTLEKKGQDSCFVFHLSDSGRMGITLSQAQKKDKFDHYLKKRGKECIGLDIQEIELKLQPIMQRGGYSLIPEKTKYMTTKDPDKKSLHFSYKLGEAIYSMIISVDSKG